VQIGTPEDLFERPAHTFVGYFIGSPGMNVLDAEVSGQSATLAGTTIALGASYGATSGKTQLGVRPEFVRLTTGGHGIPARIRRVEDVGRHKIVRLDVGGQEINAIAGEGDSIPADVDGISFDPKGINVYADDWRIEPIGGGAAR
jgi:glycerol transport system ATP-binding protein